MTAKPFRGGKIRTDLTIVNAGKFQMDHTGFDTLDEKILEEKKLVAREHFLDAWEAGLLDGIDADIIALELISGALRQISRSLGAEASGDLIAEIADMDMRGEFLPQKILN